MKVKSEDWEDGKKKGHGSHVRVATRNYGVEGGSRSRDSVVYHVLPS